MAKIPFFSVIIPTLNEEDYLPKILSDLAKQKLKNFGVIVVDADSKDKTKIEAQKFSKKFPLSLHCVDRKNVSYQRNFGAGKAKGEFLLFLDADARVDSNFTKNIYKNIVNNKRQVFLPVLITDIKSPKNKVIFRVVNSTIKLSQSFKKPLSAGGAIFISKNLFSDLNGFKEDLFICEDHNLVQRARSLGVKAKILKDVGVVFSLRRVREEGEASMLYKYILSSIHMLINGEITKKIYSYDMDGGAKYKDVKKRQTPFRKFLHRTSEFLTDSLN